MKSWIKMKKCITLLSLLALSLSVFYGEALAVQNDFTDEMENNISANQVAETEENEFSVEIINDVLEEREPSAEELERRKAISTYAGADDDILYHTRTKTANILQSGKTVATVNCKVEFTYGIGIYESETGITNVELDIKYLANGYTYHWNTGNDYQKPLAFQASGDFYNSSKCKGVVLVFQGVLSGSSMMIDYYTTEYGSMTIPADESNGNTEKTYVLN